MLLSTILAVVAGVVVGWGMGGPLRFMDFKPLLVNGLISAGIGVVAGLSSADDVGRHYLIAVAAAAQYAVYPIWFGLAVVFGFPGWAMTLEHLGTFVLNVSTIGLVALLTYARLMRAVRLGRSHSRRGSTRTGAQRDAQPGDGVHGLEGDSTL